MDLVKKYILEAESKRKKITEATFLSDDTKKNSRRAWNIFKESFQEWFSGMTSVLEDEMEDDDNGTPSDLLDEVYSFEKAFRKLDASITKKTK